MTASHFLAPLAAPVTKTPTIGFIDKYSFSVQSQLHTSICTHIQTYSTIHIYTHRHIVCLSFIPMSLTINPGTHVLMYSCTHVLMYSCTCTHVLMYLYTPMYIYISSQLIRYCYYPASISTKTHPSIYYICMHPYIYILFRK